MQRRENVYVYSSYFRNVFRTKCRNMSTLQLLSLTFLIFAAVTCVKNPTENLKALLGFKNIGRLYLRVRERNKSEWTFPWDVRQMLVHRSNYFSFSRTIQNWSFKNARPGYEKSYRFPHTPSPQHSEADQQDRALQRGGVDVVQNLGFETFRLWKSQIQRGWRKVTNDQCQVCCWR